MTRNAACRGVYSIPAFLGITILGPQAARRGRDPACILKFSGEKIARDSFIVCPRGGPAHRRGNTLWSIGEREQLERASTLDPLWRAGLRCGFRGGRT